MANILQLNIPLLYLVLTGFLFLNPASSDSKTDKLINKICRNTVDYGFCYKVFHQNMKSPSTDAIGLARITIDQASHNATNNYAFVADLHRREKDPKKQYLLMHCVYGYNELVGSFDLASRYWNQRNFARMLDVERNAPYQLRQCISLFATINPDIGERNEQMSNLMAMAIITTLIIHSE